MPTPYEDAAAAYNRGDYETARRLWLPLAEVGNTDAQTKLGLIYEKGQGVPHDYAAATMWYRKAADQGDPTAQFFLGMMYENGRGVPQEDAIAVNWYRKAADQGEPNAQCNLGFMYYNGRGVTRDYGTAATWFCKAAEQGQISCQFNLGLMYENGLGVAQDYATAASWYRKAAEQGHARARARAHEAEQHAKEQEQKQQNQGRARSEKEHLHEARVEALRKCIEFTEAFQNVLRDVAADALVPLLGTVHGGLLFTSLYSPPEITSGMSAAEDAGLSAEEGVICFVMLCATVEAELQKRGGFLQRLKAKLPPKQGTRAHAHLAMFNYVRETPPGGHIPGPEAFDMFARRYNEILSQNAKT
jgi:TPR repeat protein